MIELWRWRLARVKRNGLRWFCLHAIMNGWRVMAGFGLLVTLLSSCLVGQSVSYTLTDWSCGVIVWPTEAPTYAEDFAQRLSEAVAATFSFWESDIPEQAEPPYDVTKSFRIYDPATQADRDIPPLQWGERLTAPVVVFAFEDEDTMRLTMGSTKLYGAMWCHSPLTKDGFPNAQDWIWLPGAGFRNMLCAASADEGILIHEFTHWFMYQWCYARGIIAAQLPNYIVEGMAELACSSASDRNESVYDRLQAVSWAQTKCLSASIRGVMMYSVGKSLVGHLADELGVSGFLETLFDWSTRAWAMIDLVQSGWRTSLGLPADCPGEASDS